MRPVERGEHPREHGTPVVFHEYAEARSHLIACLGEYCSYCGMQLDAALAVEHVKPKIRESATRELSWANFLLACVNCNSTKGDEETTLPDYLWPDQDNPMAALCYGPGALVEPAEGLSAPERTRAENTIRLTGLDHMPSRTQCKTASDRRWLHRQLAWDLANKQKAKLARHRDAPSAVLDDLRDDTLELALARGYWPVWYTVFQDDADMRHRLLAAFPGTHTASFDPADGRALVRFPAGG